MLCNTSAVYSTCESGILVLEPTGRPPQLTGVGFSAYGGGSCSRCRNDSANEPGAPGDGGWRLHRDVLEWASFLRASSMTGGEDRSTDCEESHRPLSSEFAQCWRADKVVWYFQKGRQQSETSALSLTFCERTLLISICPSTIQLHFDCCGAGGGKKRRGKDTASKLQSESQRPGFSARGQKPWRMVDMESHDAQSARGKKKRRRRSRI